MPINRHRQHRDILPDDLKYGHQKGKAAAIDTRQQGADATDAVDEALRDLYIDIPDIDLKGIIEDDDEAAEKAPKAGRLTTEPLNEGKRPTTAATYTAERQRQPKTTTNTNHQWTSLSWCRASTSRWHSSTRTQDRSMDCQRTRD